MENKGRTLGRNSFSPVAVRGDSCFAGNFVYSAKFSNIEMKSLNTPARPPKYAKNRERVNCLARRDKGKVRLNRSVVDRPGIFEAEQSSAPRR